MRKAACVAIATTLIVTAPVYGQNGDQIAALQQALNGQFTLTKLSADRNDILTAGTVLILQKNGLTLYSVASPKPSLNTYKNGKISQGMGGFGRDLAITMAQQGNGTAADFPQRKFASGDGLWVAEVVAQKDAIVLQLYSDPFDDVRYYGQLKFPFDKRSIPSPDEALARIAEVLTIKPPDSAADNPAPAAPAPGVLQNQDVIKMVKAGLDDSIIIAKIKTSKCQFDTTPDTLIALKQTGVSSAVLKAMTMATP